MRGGAYSAPLLVIAFLLLFSAYVAPSLNQPVLKLSAGEERVFEIRSLEDYELVFDFHLTQFSGLAPAFELWLSEDATIKVFACAGPKAKPGVYLYLSGKETAGSPVLVYPGSWFRLVITSVGDKTTVELVALNDTWLAPRVELVPSLYKQGLAYDGRVWYYTATDMIFRLKPDGTVDDYNDFPIPPELMSEGYFHLGDPDYYNGHLLIPVEKRGYVKPAVIALYDAKTLKIVKYAYTPQDHMPWLAVDDKGYVYSSEFSPASEVYVYRLSDVGEGNYVEPVRVIKLSRELKGVQGGVVYEGKLYVSVIGWNVYVIDLETGEVSELFKVPPMYEMEGIEVCKLSDGTLFHVLVNTFQEENVVYHYARFSKGDSLKLFELEGKVRLSPKIKVKARLPMKLVPPKVVEAKAEEGLPALPLTVAVIVALAVVAAILFGRRRARR